MLLKKEICVVYDWLCLTFAEVNLKSLFSVFYIYKRMMDLCYKDSLWKKKNLAEAQIVKSPAKTFKYL